MIGSVVTKISDFKAQYKEIANKCFKWSAILKDTKLENFLEILKDDLHLFVEFPYVDKLFRDSYYNYFSSSHKPVQRNALRVSFFAGKLTKEEFYNSDTHSKIQRYYIGYCILRPLNGNMLGRSFISPKALKNHNFVCCLSMQKTSILGVPFEINGFPHSTQDGRMISCAETSIWSITEYFGSKYPEYALVLPHKIHNILKETYHQRHLPSNGLTAIQISAALQQLGYAPRMYSVAHGRNNEREIFSIISDYIESGIPLVLAVQGEKFGGHAMLLIGHSNIDNKITKATLKEQFTDAGDFRDKYVAIDDNRPVYQLLDLYKPMASYEDSKFHEAKIISAIVPLYTKMYLEAPTAKKLFETIFLDKTLGYKGDNSNKWIVRRLLTSSKSFKKWISISNSLSDNQRKMLLETALPKFIWIAEYMTHENFKAELSNIMIILDATGMNSRESLVFARYPDRYLFVDNTNGRQKEVIEISRPMPLYKNNLKGEWNQWKSN